MHIVDTHRYTQIDAIVDIAADIKVILSDIAFVGTVEVLTRSLVVITLPVTGGI